MEPALANYKAKRDDPFYEEPLHKAYYYPSRLKELDGKKRQTALTSERLKGEKIHSLDKTEERFLKETNTYSSKLPPDGQSPRDNSSKFDESWPDSERPSTVRYVERFRHGVPLSREERQMHKKTDPHDFWWLSSPPTPNGSSTPKSDTGSGSKTKARRPPSPGRSQDPREDNITQPYLSEFLESSHATAPREIRTREFVDEQTHNLQQKADHLLEQAEGSLNSSEPAVSTEGLGSTPSFSSVDEQPYRPSFLTRDSGKDSFLTDNPHYHGYIGASKSMRLEEDILHQWRQKRRLEIMRETAQQRAAHVDMWSSHVHVHHRKDEDDIDSRLQKFRERLSHAALQESEPQGYNTAGELGQKSKKESPLSKEVRTVEIQTEIKTDASVQTNEAQRTYASKDANAQMSRSPIASPSLKRKQSQPETDIEPHLHLMCDILPCPHDHVQQDYEQEVSESECKQSKTKENYSDSDSNGESCDSDFEQYKRLHFKKLQKEMAKREKTDGKVSKVYEGKSTLKESQASKCRQNSQSLDYQDEVPERDGTAKIKNHGTRALYDSRDHETKVELAKGKARKTDTSSKVHGRDKEGSSVGSSRERTSNKVSEPVRERKSGKSSKKREGSISECKKDRDASSKESSMYDSSDWEEKPAPSKNRHKKASTHTEGRIDHQKTQREHQGKRFPKPKVIHSSPKPSKSTLHSAIDQVVKDRLFPLSSVSLQSSTDTLATELHREESDREETTLTEQNLAASTEPDVAARNDMGGILAVSDGEEFPDDDMLVELRERRAQYLTRLRQIDQLLQGK